jgi:hypothetical protein
MKELLFDLHERACWRTSGGAIFQRTTVYMLLLSIHDIDHLPLIFPPNKAMCESRANHTSVRLMTLQFWFSVWPSLHGVLQLPLHVIRSPQPNIGRTQHECMSRKRVQAAEIDVAV